MDGGRAVADEKAATQQSDARQQTAQKSALVEEAERVAATLNDKLPPLSGDEVAASGNRRSSAPERAGGAQAARVEEAFGTPAAQQIFHSEDGGGEGIAEHAAGANAAATAQTETRSPLRQRAASVGASVGENLRPRVEKLREASTVVFDEATDDPGLRFVIVAALLFLVFLFIFLFSYILG